MPCLVLSREGTEIPPCWIHPKFSMRFVSTNTQLSFKDGVFNTWHRWLNGDMLSCRNKAQCLTQPLDKGNGEVELREFN